MSESSLSISTVVEPFAGALIGSGIGYSMAPRKYSLKRLLIMQPQKMSQIYSDDIVKQMSKKEKEALQKILDAKEKYRLSRSQNYDDIKRTAQIWSKKFREIEIPKTLQDSYQQTRKALVEAMEKENYININKLFRSTKKAAQQSPENTLLQRALTSANETLATARAKLAGKIENYSNVVRNIYNERLHSVKTQPAKYAGVKEAYNNLLIALARRRTIVSNRLFELSNDRSLIKSYNTIREYLPKARTRSAVTGAMILGCMTAIAASRFSPKQVTA